MIHWWWQNRHGACRGGQGSAAAADGLGDCYIVVVTAEAGVHVQVQAFAKCAFQAGHGPHGAVFVLGDNRRLADAESPPEVQYAHSVGIVRVRILHGLRLGDRERR